MIIITPQRRTFIYWNLAPATGPSFPSKLDGAMDEPGNTAPVKMGQRGHCLRSLLGLPLLLVNWVLPLDYSIPRLNQSVKPKITTSTADVAMSRSADGCLEGMVTCTDFTKPLGWQVSGFHGASTCPPQHSHWAHALDLSCHHTLKAPGSFALPSSAIPLRGPTFFPINAQDDFKLFHLNHTASHGDTRDTSGVDLKGTFQQDDSVLHSRIFQDLSAPAGTSNSKEWEGVGFSGFPINKRSCGPSNNQVAGGATSQDFAYARSQTGCQVQESSPFKFAPQVIWTIPTEWCFFQKKTHYK